MDTEILYPKIYNPLAGYAVREPKYTQLDPALTIDEAIVYVATPIVLTGTATVPANMYGGILSYHCQADVEGYYDIVAAEAGGDVLYATGLVDATSPLSALAGVGSFLGVIDGGTAGTTVTHRFSGPTGGGAATVTACFIIVLFPKASISETE